MIMFFIGIVFEMEKIIHGKRSKFGKLMFELVRSFLCIYIDIEVNMFAREKISIDSIHHHISRSKVTSEREKPKSMELP